MAMYKSPSFVVKTVDIKSQKKFQSTGIRQGGPLSPHLFTLGMTCLLEDVHFNERGALVEHWVIGAAFDEVPYADDTVCISESAAPTNRMLKVIELESDKIWI